MLKLISIYASIMVVSCSIAYANIAPSRIYIKEIEPKAVGVQLIKEDLFLTLHSDLTVSVEARFWFEGNPPGKVVPVYFPRTEMADDKEFVVTINGVAVEVSVDAYESGHIKGYNWDIPMPDSEAEVVVSYVADLFNSDDYRGTFYYSLTTGAEWEEDIGELNMYVSLYGITPSDVTMLFPSGYDYTGDGFEWHFSDFEPEDDICIAFFRHKGFEIAKAEGFYKNRYVDLGNVQCDKALQSDDPIVRKYANLYLARHRYFPNGEYEKCIETLASEPLTYFLDEGATDLDIACQLESLRSELILGQIDVDDERLKKLTTYRDVPFVYYYKSLAGKVPINAKEVMLILENQEGATADERSYLMHKAMNQEIDKYEQGYWLDFIDKYPNSPLVPVAKYLDTSIVLRESDRRGSILNRGELENLGDKLAKISDDSLGILRLWASIDAYGSYIEVRAFDKAIPYLERTITIYKEKGRFPQNRQSKYGLRNFLSKKGYKSTRNFLNSHSNEDASALDKFYERFFSNRILFYIEIKDTDMFNKALDDYEAMYPNSAFTDYILE